MSSNEVVLEVKDLCKCYQIYDHPHDRLKQFIAPKIISFFGKQSRCFYREFWAVKNVSFEVKRGETFGIIGRNGSGKSTLLQMICGTVIPTGGSITTRGRIGALLELGSGFNPEFTGRENIYLNAAVLGLSVNQIEKYFDEILAFADIGSFIEQPIKTYSSGMAVRLAFAIQAMIDPDILIVDEALSVGDAKFQAKCFDRLKRLRDRGTSILLVTHSDAQIVTHCTKALLLDSGSIISVGEPRQVVNHYVDLLFGKTNKEVESIGNRDPIKKPKMLDSCLSSNADNFSTHPCYNQHEYRWGNRNATIIDFYLEAEGESYPAAITSGQTITLFLAIKFHVDIVRPIIGVTIKTKEGITVYGANSETLDIEEIKSQGRKNSVVFVKADFDCFLSAGDYFVSLGVASMQSGEVVPHDRRYDSIHLQVRPTPMFFGLSDLDLKLTVVK